MKTVIKTVFYTVLAMPFFCRADVIAPAFYDTKQYTGLVVWREWGTFSLILTLFFLTMSVFFAIKFIKELLPEKTVDPENPETLPVKNKKNARIVFYLLGLLLSLLLTCASAVFKSAISSNPEVFNNQPCSRIFNQHNWVNLHNYSGSSQQCTECLLIFHPEQGCGGYRIKWGERDATSQFHNASNVIGSWE